VPGWKKQWSITASVEEVQSMLKAMPRVYLEAASDGLLARMGRTFGHQRRDIKPKAPILAKESPGELVFQHDLVKPITYKVSLKDNAGWTELILEIKTSSTAKDTSIADHISFIFYTLSKSLEVTQWTQPA